MYLTAHTQPLPRVADAGHDSHTLEDKWRGYVKHLIQIKFLFHSDLKYI